MAATPAPERPRPAHSASLENQPVGNILKTDGRVRRSVPFCVQKGTPRDPDHNRGPYAEAWRRVLQRHPTPVATSVNRASTVRHVEPTSVDVDLDEAEHTPALVHRPQHHSLWCALAPTLEVGDLLVQQGRQLHRPNNRIRGRRIEEGVQAYCQARGPIW